jgi:putative membrane protein
VRQKFYHPKTVWKFLFSFHKEKSFSRLRPLLIAVTIYAALVSIGEYYLHDRYKIFDEFTYLGQFHLLFNFVLSVLIGFRVNTAYARWWEARGLWGQLTNHTRNLTLRLASYFPLSQQPKLVDKLASFALVLKSHLRQDREGGIELLASLGLQVGPSDHIPTALLQSIYNEISQMRQTHGLTLEQFLLVSDNLGGLTDVMGGCEKILNTRIPSAFNTLIKQALVFYMLIFPFGWADTFGLFVIPLIIVMIYVLWGLEALADELEDPFGFDENDLQLDTMSVNIANNVKQIARLG